VSPRTFAIARALSAAVDCSVVTRQPNTQFQQRGAAAHGNDAPSRVFKVGPEGAAQLRRLFCFTTGE
jgi:hypothetical protein